MLLAISTIRYFRPIWPILGEIRLSTILMALLIVGLIAWKRRSPVGIVVMLAWAAGYELIDNGTAVLLQHASVSYFIWTAAAYGGWLIAAWALRIRPEHILTGIFAILWVVWIAAGFHANVTGGTFVLSDELLNEATKTILGLAFLLGALKIDLLSAAQSKTLEHPLIKVHTASSVD